MQVALDIFCAAYDGRHMDLHARYPAVSDLRTRAKKRIPKFVWEYLDSATGEERTKARNRQKLDEILFEPSILHGELSPDVTTSFLGQTYDVPVGIAPVGMSGLIWPGAEQTLAQAAVYLASAPKSNALYAAYGKARAAVI